jgi:hypothetical protein
MSLRCPVTFCDQSRQRRVAIQYNVNASVNARSNKLKQVCVPPIHMPGPQNAKKKKRTQQKKKHHAKTHSHPESVVVQISRCTLSDPSSPPPTLVTLLPSPPSTDAHKTKCLCPNSHRGASRRSEPKSSSPLPRTPYGPQDDPTLILLSNPIIYDPGNGPRVRNMRAFLKSSFAHPVWTADPLCAEFAQREILQMLRTVLPEETALVRPLPRSFLGEGLLPALRNADDFCVLARPSPSFNFSRSAYGTTKAGESGVSALPVSFCTP